MATTIVFENLFSKRNHGSCNALYGRLNPFFHDDATKAAHEFARHVESCMPGVLAHLLIKSVDEITYRTHTITVPAMHLTPSGGDGSTVQREVIGALLTQMFECNTKEVFRGDNYQGDGTQIPPPDTILYYIEESKKSNNELNVLSFDAMIGQRETTGSVGPHGKWVNILNVGALTVACQHVDCK